MSFQTLWAAIQMILAILAGIGSLQPGQTIDVPLGAYVTWQDGRRFVVESAKVRRIT